MIEKPCRCGAIKKNFQIDIGPFFIYDCCVEAGYDHMGNKAEEAKSVEVAPAKEETPKKKRTYNKSGNVKKDA